MGAKYGFCKGARLEKSKAEQDGIAHTAPYRAYHVPARGNPLYQYRIDSDTDDNQKPLKAHRQQGTEIVLAHVPNLPVDYRCKGDWGKACH